MGWNLPSGTTMEPAPAGAHAARCYRLIDLGTQVVNYQGQEKQTHQVMISWELSAKMADGQPYTIHQKYGAFMSQKAKLRQMLEGWRGRKFSDDEARTFDLDTIVGKPCMVTVVHSEKGYAYVDAVSQLPNGLEAPKAHNPQVYFNLSEFNGKVYAALPERLRGLIANSPEYQDIAIGDAHEPANAVEVMEDDIPF